MDLYIKGVVVAFVIGIIKVVVGLRMRSSTRAKNFARLGLHYRVGNDAFEVEGTSAAGWLGYVGYMLVLAPLFSWISVAAAVWTFLSFRHARSRLKVEFKAFLDLLDSRELSREQLIEAQEATQTASGKPGAAVTSADGDDPARLVLMDDDGYYSEVTARPQDKMLEFYGHTDDHQTIFHSVEEYRFEGTQVLTRLLSDHDEDLGKKVWHVKDGVVLESEIRKRAEASTFTVTPVEEEIAKYRVQTEWTPVQSPRLRFFIMAQHPAEFPVRERRRLIRTEIERIEAGVRKAAEHAKAQGFLVSEDEKGLELRFPKDAAQAEKDRLDSLMPDGYYASVGITSDERRCFKAVRADLLKLLGEPAPG